MCGLIMLIFGLVAIIKGTFSLTRNRVVEGTPARIVGVILCLPLPLAFMIALALGAFAAATGRQVDPDANRPGYMLIDAAVTVGCLLLAVVVAAATANVKKPARECRIRDDRDEDYDDRPRRRRRDDYEDDRDRGDEHIQSKD